MSSSNERVLPAEKIPKSLWEAPHLTLPESLRVSYEAELSGIGLLQEARDGTKEKRIFGGETEEETKQHFAHRFAASSGRVEYCMIGPDGGFAELSNALLTTFSEGEVALLDLPCGTGAASGTLLSTIISLRKEGVIPRLPLHIEISAGDFADPARAIFESMLIRLLPAATEQGITFGVSSMHWDATRSDSTAALMDSWFTQSAAATEWMVLITNFSGTLNNQSAFDSFKPCLEHIAARLHNRQATLVWAEPAGSSKSKGLLKFLKDFAEDRLSWFFRKTNTGEAPVIADFQLRHPLKNSAFRSDVAIERFERTL
jgi:hypothetical protein